MKTCIRSVIAATIAVAASNALAQPPIENVTIECNWGTLTMESIKDGFDQGQHSSDPGSNGRGKDDPDQPRAGLGNVVNQGDLQATCEFIEALLED